VQLLGTIGEKMSIGTEKKKAAQARLEDALAGSILWSVQQGRTSACARMPSGHAQGNWHFQRGLEFVHPRVFAAG
jgi:hypothetical protein